MYHIKTKSYFSDDFLKFGDKKTPVSIKLRVGPLFVSFFGILKPQRIIG